jgi:glycosyltransferase involved in cell wall biosynthesis
VRRAARVIAVSEHTRRDLGVWLSVPQGRVTVVPNGVAEAFHAPADPARVAYLRRRHGLGVSLIACVGTVQPRKRVDRVIAAFTAARLVERGWQLVVAGRVRPGYRPPWIDAPPTGVVWLGTLPDDDLPALYAASAIAVSASEYEGFGLSVAEAMASGCAVIAVASSSLPEVVGDGAMLLERSDAGLLAGALRELSSDASTRGALAVRGRARAGRFRWREAAARTSAVYEEVAGCPRA